MIKVEHVSKSFGRVRALHDISLEIEPGERIALVGSNGSGKTTLLRALLGLVRVEGRILIGADDVAKYPARALAGLAYMPQISPPLDAPVRDVVAAYCSLRGIPRESCFERAETLGLRLESALSTRFRDLSGGMRQKLLAAMALAANAPILVCDEPTANLDAQARDACLVQIEARPADSILIVCSHRDDDVRSLVTRVISLCDGVVVSDRPMQPSATRLKAVSWNFG